MLPNIFGSTYIVEALSEVEKLAVYTITVEPPSKRHFGTLNSGHFPFIAGLYFSEGTIHYASHKKFNFGDYTVPCREVFNTVSLGERVL